VSHLRLFAPDARNLEPSPQQIADQFEIPDACGCRPAAKAQLCVILYGPQGCTPRCITRTNPQGCTPACVDTSLPAGCLERRDTGRCWCRKLPCRHAKGHCECPRIPGPPCRHVQATDHGLSVAEWAELLLALLPADYREPPPPAAGSSVLTRQARVALRVNRQRAGQALWHADDLTARKVRQDLEDATGDLAIRAGRLRNGAVNPQETLTIEEERLRVLADDWDEDLPDRSPGHLDRNGQGRGWDDLHELREANRAAWRGRQAARLTKRRAA
jgi:hypothetical protein